MAPKKNQPQIKQGKSQQPAQKPAYLNKKRTLSSIPSEFGMKKTSHKKQASGKKKKNGKRQKQQEHVREDLANSQQNISSEDDGYLDGETLVYGEDVQEILKKNTKSQQKSNNKQVAKNVKLQKCQQQEEVKHVLIQDDEVEQINTSSKVPGKLSAVIESLQMMSPVFDQISGKRSASCKAKQQIAQQFIQDIDGDGNQQNYNQSNQMYDEEYQPIDEEQKRNSSQIEKKTAKFKIPSKRICPLTDEELKIMYTISNNFKKAFMDLGLKNHDKFKSWSSNKFIAVKTWYKNIRRGHAKKPEIETKNIEIKKIEYPNEVLMNAIRDGDIPEQYLPIFAEAVENYLEAQCPHVYQFFIDRTLKEVLSKLSNYDGDIQQLVSILKQTPTQIRLKATAKAITILKNTGQYTDDYKLSWFNHCVRPSLAVSDRINYLDFDLNEIESIKDICEFGNPYQMTNDEAFSYLNLLKRGKLFDLDLARKHFIDKSNEFWEDVLLKICGINKEAAQICIANKYDMLTNALYQHYLVSNMSIAFAEVIALFQQMTYQELFELHQMSNLKGFPLVIPLLSKDVKHDFQIFKQQASVFLKLDNSSQIQAYQKLLPQVPLCDWNKYQHQVLASSSLCDDAKALKIINDVLGKLYNSDDLDKLEEVHRVKFERQWNKAFKELNEKIVLLNFGWQKELVVSILHLLTMLQKNNILVTLGTGHGKSVIIQLLADILAERGNEVIIVCLNDYLAHQARRKYESPNVRFGKVTYMTLHEFLKRMPDRCVYVIFDEIDQMMGVQSFNVVHQDSTTVKAIYNINLMKQWKSIIGFSGTIADSTTTQMIAELKDPLCIDIPSLRLNGNSNKLISVNKVKDQAQLFNSVQALIVKLQSTEENFIIIFEDAKVLNQFKDTSAYFGLIGLRNCITFDDFTDDETFPTITKNLQEVARDRFIVLTTKQGARGVDYKGVNPAHVIITFGPENYAQCAQILGRGSRELSHCAKGSIICQEKPLTEYPENYLELLRDKDAALAGILRTNCKIARLLHNQITTKNITDDELQQIFDQEKIVVDSNRQCLTLLMFEQVMKKGQNIMKVEGGDKLWDALRVFDKDQRMPDDCYQKWNQ